MQQYAVDFTTRQFANLDRYRHPEGSGPVSPLSDGLRDPIIAIKGDYPATRVEVTFRHPAYPQGRLRSVHTISDSAGRTRVDPHLATWLMEDLDTRALSGPDAVVDGFLTI